MKTEAEPSTTASLSLCRLRQSATPWQAASVKNQSWTRFGPFTPSHAVARHRMKSAIYLRLCVHAVAWCMTVSNQRFIPAL